MDPEINTWESVRLSAPDPGSPRSFAPDHPTQSPGLDHHEKDTNVITTTPAHPHTRTPAQPPVRPRRHERPHCEKSPRRVVQITLATPPS